jgi:hypothetical protein
MFGCLIIGDSVALGTAAAIEAIRPSVCTSVARVGASTAQVRGWRLANTTYGSALIATGSNDLPGAGMRSAIRKLRLTIPSRRLIWILPYERRRASIVAEVAVRFGDGAVDLRQFPTRDGVHPVNYRAVASSLLR